MTSNTRVSQGQDGVELSTGYTHNSLSTPSKMISLLEDAWGQMQEVINLVEQVDMDSLIDEDRQQIDDVVKVIDAYALAVLEFSTIIADADESGSPLPPAEMIDILHQSASTHCNENASILSFIIKCQARDLAINGNKSA